MASSSQAQRIYSGPTYSQGGAAFNGDLHAARNININHFTTVRPWARSLHRSCLASSDLFKDIQNGLATLVTALEATEETCMEFCIDVSNHPTLCSLSQSSHQVLQRFQDLKTHFDNMDAQTQQTWERLAWGEDELKFIRKTMSSHIATLNLFNTNMINSSQARMEQMMKKFLGELRIGRREGSVIYTQTINSLSTDDREAWRQLRKELENIGITPALFTQHQSFIVATLQKAINDGDLVENAALDHSDLRAELVQETLLASQLISPTSKMEASANLPDTPVRRPSSQGPSPVETSSNRMPKEGKPRVLKKPSRVAVILSQLMGRHLALSAAASRGDAIRTKLLLEGRAVSSRDLGHALLKASQKGHVEVVKLLLACPDIDVNHASYSDYWTPLSHAVLGGHEAVVKLLLACPDIDVNYARSYGYTPLLEAAEKGNEAVVKLLLACPDIDVNQASYSGWTPLLEAAEKGNEAVVKLLLAHPDVDISVVDPENHTPLSMAAYMGNDRVVNLLLAKFNVQVDSKDNFERTFSSWATENGHGGWVRAIFVEFTLFMHPKDAPLPRKSNIRARYYGIIRHVLARFDE